MSVRGVDGEVERHDRRRAPVVGEGRLGHALVAQRHEVREPVLLLGREDGDRVAARRGLERGVADPRDALAGGLARLARARSGGPRAAPSRRGPAGRLGLPGGVVRRRGRLVRDGLPRSPRRLLRFGHGSVPPGAAGWSPVGDHHAMKTRRTIPLDGPGRQRGEPRPPPAVASHSAADRRPPPRCQPADRRTRGSERGAGGPVRRTCRGRRRPAAWTRSTGRARGPASRYGSQRRPAGRTAGGSPAMPPLMSPPT